MKVYKTLKCDTFDLYLKIPVGREYFRFILRDLCSQFTTVIAVLKCIQIYALDKGVGKCCSYSRIVCMTHFLKRCTVCCYNICSYISLITCITLRDHCRSFCINVCKRVLWPSFVDHISLHGIFLLIRFQEWMVTREMCRNIPQFPAAQFYHFKHCAF